MTQPAHADTEKATPRPWRIKPRVSFGQIEGATGTPVVVSASMFVTPIAYEHDAPAAANAALIVKAVNAYQAAIPDAVREALKAARQFERAVKAYSAWNTRPSDEYERGKYDAMKRLFAALAAAEGKGQ